MSNVNFKEHCPVCRTDKPCSNRVHVYVAELDPRIYEEKPWFADANPDWNRSKPCVYVGMTSHHPLCRMEQHKHCIPNEWPSRTYRCFCTLHEEEFPSCTKFTKASTKVHSYMTGRLKPKLHKRWNPVHSKLGKVAEETLGEHLRSKGYAVWFDKT
jgi:hypothetical protein